MIVSSYINRYTITSLFFFLIVFLVINYAKRRGTISIKKDCKEALGKEVNGLVQNAYFDNDINVKAFVIVFKNGDTCITPIFSKSLSGIIEVGDSVSKRKGTFNFEIFKKGDSTAKIFENRVDCSSLK